MNYPKTFFNKIVGKLVLLFAVFVGCLFFSNEIKASHIVGGEMTYVCLGNNEYEISLTIYRDCLNGSNDAPFDDTVSIGIFDSNDELVLSLGTGTNPGQINIPFSTSEVLTSISSDSCLMLNTGVCLEVSTYSAVVVLPAISGGYQLAYQRCCRNSQINNIVSPANTGLTVYTFLSEESLEDCLSSPQFGPLPPSVVCINEPFVIDQSVTLNADIDSIHYRLCTPLSGGTLTNTQPQPPSNPPYEEVDWFLPNFTYFNPLGGAALTIDLHTGELTGIPNSVGLFVFGICIEEYYKGEVISSIRRDVQITVGICNSINAEFAATEIQCNDFEVTFDNESTMSNDFEWNFGDPTSSNNTSTDENPTHVFSGVGSYDVMLIAEPGSICSDTIIKTIQLLESDIQADFNYVVLDCGNELELYLNDLSTVSSGNILEWKWSIIGGNQTMDVQNPVFTILPGTNPIIGLEVFSSDGCSSYIQKIIPNTASPGNFMPLEFEICEGEEVMLNPTPISNPDFIYAWGPNTFISDPDIPSPTVFPTTTTKYQLILKSTTDDCVQEFEVTVNVINEIEIDINVSSTACGGSTTLFASSNVSPEFFIWSDDPDFNNVLSTNSSLTVSTLGTTTYYVQVSSSGDCKAVEEITLIEQSINVELENNLIMCLGTEEEIKLVNLDSNDDLTISWTPNVGIVSGANESNVVINPTQAGQYIYYVEVQNQFFCEYIDSVFVNVIDSEEEPQITTIQDCDSYEVLIQHEGANFPYYFWEINQGNGTIDTVIGPAVNYTFPSTGTYNLTLYPVPGLPCNLEPKEFEIVVLEESIEADFEWSYINCNDDLELQFTDASVAFQGNINSWLWNFSNGDVSIQQNPIVNLNNGQDLEIKLIVTSDLGCVDTVTRTITASVLEIPPLENTITLCENMEVELYPNGSSSFEYQWSPATFLNDATAVSPIATVTSSQTFQVTITDPQNNNCEVIESVEVIVPNQVINASFDFEYANCTTDSFTIVFEDTSIPGIGNIISSNWEFSDGQTASGSPILLIVEDINTLEIELTVTDEGGCMSVVSQTIELVGINVSLEEEIVKCAGLPVNLNPNGDPTLSYMWSPSDNLINGDDIANPIANPIVTTTYCATVTDGTCEIIDCITVIVPDESLDPEFSFEISNCITEAEISFLDETQYSFSNIIAWNWTFSNGTTSDEQNPTVTLTQNTDLIVELEIETEDGCKATVTQTIEVKLIEIDLEEKFVICDGGVFLNPNGNTNQTYLWSPNNGLSDPTSPNPLAEPNQTTTYVVEISNGPCLIIETIEVFVPDVLLTPDFSYNVDGCTDVAIIDFIDQSLYSPGNIVGWNWQFSNGDSSNIANPQVTLNQSQVLDVELEVTTEDGCVASFNQSIDIDLIDINVQDTIINCSGSTVELNPGGNSSYSYQWSPSTGLIGSATSPNPSANPTTSTTYTVVVTAGVCELTRTVDVIVPTTPLSANFEYNFDDCTDNVIIEFTDLSESTGQSIESWAWVFAGSSVIESNLQNPVVTYNQSELVDVKLIVTTIDGCVDSVSQMVEIDLIDINVAQNIVFCPSETLILNPNGDPTYTYQWSPAALLSDDDVPSPQVLGIFQNTEFSVTVSNGNCSLTRTTEVIFPDIPLQAAFSLSYNSCIDTAEIIFQDETIYSGTVVEWDWQIGSEFSDEQNPVMQFDQNQAVDVQLIVTSEEGCQDTVNANVDVAILDLNMQDSISSCNGEGAFLNPNGNPNYEYLWSPGIPLSLDSTLANPFASFNDPVLFSVSITNPAIGCTDTTSVFFNVPVMPLTADFDYSILSCSDTTLVEFNDLSTYSGIIDNWSWSIENGSNSMLQNPILSFTNADTLDMKLIVNSNDGCIDSTTLEIVIDVMEIGTIEESIILCEEGTVNLNPFGNADLIYNWSPDSILDVSNIANPLATPLLGTNEYSVTITNPNNLECFDVRTVTVLMSQAEPEIIFPNSQDTLICGGSIELDGQANFASSYLWSTNLSFQDTLSTAADVNIIIAGTPQTYYFKATNDVGCFDIDSITVSGEGFSIEFPEDEILCLGDTLEIELINPTMQGSELQYEWNSTGEIISGESTSTILVSPTETTEYEYLVYTNDGCEVSNSVNVQVLDLADIISIQADRDSIDEGETMQLNVTNIPGLEYKWVPCSEDISDCSIANPIVSPLATTNYAVEVFDMVNGCFYRDSILINVRSLTTCEEPYIFVPKGFTPNDDGLNDILYVRGNAIDEMTFVLYNRWGEKVFETNDKNIGWDGKINGKLIPPDVFGYYLTIKCVKGETFRKQGNVTLIR